MAILKPEPEKIQEELDLCKNVYQQLVVLDKYGLATENQRILKDLIKVGYGPKPKSSLSLKQQEERRRKNKQARKARRINRQRSR
jgi:hypothetical protein